MCRRSAAYPVYTKVLEDIHAVVRAIDSSSYASVGKCVTEGDGFTYQAPHNQRDGSRCKTSLGLGLGAGSTSSTNRVTKPNSSKRPQASSSGKDVLVALGDNVVRADDIKVACPVFKHHVMSGETPPCNGCPVKSMAQGYTTAILPSSNNARDARTTSLKR
jgi:hypothetical protein